MNGDVYKSFLAKLRAAPWRWKVRRDGAIRYGAPDYSVARFLGAALELGFGEEDARRIAASADSKEYYSDYYDARVRADLLAATGLEEK